MLTLLSPAKKMNFETFETSLSVTQPRLPKETKALAKVAKTQTASDLKRLMHISDNLAELNAERFKTFQLDNQSNSAKPAGLTFDGDVYWGLEAHTLSDADLEYAQNHLRILSGLYGLLRPMDAIQPYRLEMGTKLETERGKSLYEFWGDRLSKMIRADMDGHSDETIVNLASHEYFKAVDQKTLDRPVISAKFLNIKDGEARALMYYAKLARGQMARWIMQERVDRADGLKDFNLEGYTLDASQTTDSELVFIRQQPPKKS